MLFFLADMSLQRMTLFQCLGLVKDSDFRFIASRASLCPWWHVNSTGVRILPFLVKKKTTLKSINQSIEHSFNQSIILSINRFILDCPCASILSWRQMFFSYYICNVVDHVYFTMNNTSVDENPLTRNCKKSFRRKNNSLDTRISASVCGSSTGRVI